MHSRAHMLLEKEYLFMQKDPSPAWGIKARPLRLDNMLEWFGTIEGLKETIWEGGIFTITLTFSEGYHEVPPEVNFHTIPFHPNIDMNTGRPCLALLDDFHVWKESYSIESILLALQNLLSSPVVDNAVNSEAAALLRDSPDTYRQMVMECVRASLKVHAGESITNPKSGPRSANGESVVPSGDTSATVQVKPASGSKLARVSFDDYLTTWTGIATSKAKSDMKNPLLEAIKDNPNLQSAHFGLPLEELQLHMKKQLEEHNSLMYGNFAHKPTEQEIQDKKLDQINKMRKIYLPRRSAPPPSSAQSEVGEPWEKEVDDLVAWTTNLDEQALE
ncbi:ubiquitin-conjugating enzyme E2 U-like [Amphiura filiformis]|uniref:ubiquitin-conjugating enzyme E2 U-like n=1 Tax=Amphiura filiformis TaxID=82378 RepID=UPI003B21D3E9